MMRVIRHYFLTRALREKLLLMAFLAIGVLWWLSAFGRHAGAFLRETDRKSTRLNSSHSQQSRMPSSA